MKREKMTAKKTKKAPAARREAAKNVSMGQRIKHMREIKGMSLPALAEAAGLSKAYLSQIENDKCTNPSAELMFRVADALSTTMADIMGKSSIHASEHVNAEIPRSLVLFSKEKRKEGEKIDEDLIRTFAGLKIGSRKPRTKEDWTLIYLALKNVAK